MYYSEDEARRLVIEAGHKLLESRLIARTWGNISARISRDEFVITPSGKAYDSLRPYDLVIVKIKDASYRGNTKPSSEKGAHAAAYSLRDDISFIIHTHQYYASAVAAEGKDTEAAPCADYGLQGTDKLKNNLSHCIEDHPDSNEFLMANHGAFILGKDMEDAFFRAFKLEKYCKVLVEKRVPVHELATAESFDASKIEISALPYVKVVSDPYILECCKKENLVDAYLDDFAQMVGPDMKVVDNDPWKAERALLGYTTNPMSGKVPMMPMTGVLPRMGDQQPALNSVIGRNAVLVRHVGAVCAGKTESDAEAIATIVSKNCCAACYAKGSKPLPAIDTRLLRFIYLTQYSKLID